MEFEIAGFYHRLEEPLSLRSRFLLGVCVIPLALAFTQPLWRIQLVAPQYPQGLVVDIYAYTVEGDVRELNTLNHYIGMRSIEPASLSDLDWIPFALGALLLFALRVAAIGDVRSLLDLCVVSFYFCVFSLARFVFRLYVFGHDLDPRAAFEVEPFTPVILGTGSVANFTITSLPAGGSAWIALFGAGLALTLVWNFRGMGRPALRQAA